MAETAPGEAPGIGLVGVRSAAVSDSALPEASSDAMAAKHIVYINGEFDAMKKKESFQYCVTEHLGMSGVYWGVSAMSLLKGTDNMEQAELLVIYSYLFLKMNCDCDCVIPVHQAWFYSCPGEKVHIYVAFFSLGYTVKVTGSRVRSEDVGKTECILQGSHQF